MLKNGAGLARVGLRRRAQFLTSRASSTHADRVKRGEVPLGIPYLAVMPIGYEVPPPPLLTIVDDQTRATMFAVATAQPRNTHHYCVYL